ncbi:hypothetical protein ACOSP7_019809 [Xanthoceras sorbifolium]
MVYARKVFDRITEPNIASWNAMFKRYAQCEFHRKVVVLFRRMKKLDVSPNCFTFPIVLRSLHCFVINSVFGADAFVGTTLIELYSSGRVIEAAYKVFGEMVERNVVAWTAMINGYISCCDIASARCLFELAFERNELGNMVEARKLFDQMLKKDVISWITVLSVMRIMGTLRNVRGYLKRCLKGIFFTWNKLISGCAHNDSFFKVLDALKRMVIERRVFPNDAILAIVLSVWARLKALNLGKLVHVDAESNRYEGNKYLITWNTIIGGLAMHGQWDDALSLSSQMKNAKEILGGITFIGVLCACTHMGLIEDGLLCFQSLVDDYSIVPQIKHHGLYAKVIKFIKEMTIEAYAVIWANLFAPCKVYKNVELAELALQRLMELEPNNPTNFAMLSNIYGDLGRWKDMARAKVAMGDIGFKKLLRCSLVELNDIVIEFYFLYKRHPQSVEIYTTFKGLTKLLRSSRYTPDFEVFDKISGMSC